MKYTRLAGYSVFVGAAQFLILMIVAEAIYPGYSVSQNYISDLGNPRLAPSTPHATIFNTSIILLGLLLIIGGSILAYKERGVTGRLLGVLVAISGLGAAGVGFFPEGSPYDLHVISSLIVFLFASLASYPASLYRGHRSPLWGALGTIGLVALPLYIAKDYMGLGWGGMERMIVYPNLMWALGFSGSLMTD
jgi:Predicted membrane protein